jgi:hypothetical protein
MDVKRLWLNLAMTAVIATGAGVAAASAGQEPQSRNGGTVIQKGPERPRPSVDARITPMPQKGPERPRGRLEAAPTTEAAEAETGSRPRGGFTLKFGGSRPH